MPSGNSVEVAGTGRDEPTEVAIRQESPVTDQERTNAGAVRFHCPMSDE